MRRDQEAQRGESPEPHVSPICKEDPVGLLTFMQIYLDAKDRGYGEKSFAVARGVFEKRTGKPCPFEEC